MQKAEDEKNTMLHFVTVLLCTDKEVHKKNFGINDNN